MGSTPSGLASSHSSSKSSVFQNFSESGLMVNIDELSKENQLDKILRVKRLRVPFFDNSTLQTLANVTYITGNGPFHEGLIFETKNGLIYIAQTYPITFIMVNSYDDAVKEIVSFCQFNSSSHQYHITNSYIPIKEVTISQISNLIRALPNEYNNFAKK